MWVVSKQAGYSECCAEAGSCHDAFWKVWVFGGRSKILQNTHWSTGYLQTLLCHGDTCGATGHLKLGSGNATLLSMAGAFPRPIQKVCSRERRASAAINKREEPAFPFKGACFSKSPPVKPSLFTSPSRDLPSKSFFSHKVATQKVK
jgi:hypothetical protein